MTTPASQRWLLVLVPAVAVLSHLTALGNGFTWLDHGDLEQGAALAQPAQWLSLFSHGFARTGFYRPWTALSLSVDGWVGPWMFHCSSVLLHALVSLALLLAAESLGLSRRAAALGAALFAVHPVTSLIADQSSFRGEAWVALGLFGMIAAHLRGKALLAGGLLLIAALSKETGLVLGPMFIGALLISTGFGRRRPSGVEESGPSVVPPEGRPAPFIPSGVEGRGPSVVPREVRPAPFIPSGRRPRLPTSARVLAAEAVAFSLALSLRLRFAPPWRSHQPPLTLTEAIGTRLASVTQSARALLVETGTCDAIAITEPWKPAALLGGILLLAFAALAWRRRGVALLLVCALLPTLNLVAAPRFWSPHYLYLPWAFGAVWLASLAAERAWTWRLALGLVAIGGAASAWEALKFKNDETLFGPEVARPECREAQLYFGDARRAAGDLEAAATAYQRAAAPAPGFLAYSDEAAALQNLGLVRLSQGNHFEAEVAFEDALERTQDPAARGQLTHNLAAVALARGDPAGAVALLQPLVASGQAPRASIELLSRALIAMGREDEARALTR